MLKLGLLLILCPWIASASLINKINNDKCDNPPLPVYFNDPLGDTQCRLNLGYSRLDIVYVVERSSDGIDPLRPYLSTLALSLTPYGGDFSQADRNQAAFVTFKYEAKVEVPFSGISSYEDIRYNFFNLSNPFPLNQTSNYTRALEVAASLFSDSNNTRGNIIVLIGNYTTGYQSEAAVKYAQVLKEQGIKIFSVGVGCKFQDDTQPLISQLATDGWFFVLPCTSDDVHAQLFEAFIDKLRQTDCHCHEETLQLFAYENNDNQLLYGNRTIRYYADCSDVIDFTETTPSFSAAALCAFKYRGYQTKLAALNSPQKYEFVQKYIFNQDTISDTFFLGLEHNDDSKWWQGYTDKFPCEGPRIPILYVPISNIALCEAAGLRGLRAVMYGFLVEKTYCAAQDDVSGSPFCDVRAKDSLDNERLCPINDYMPVDPRPDEIGTACSTNLFNLWLDVVLVVETSRDVKTSQLNQVSTAIFDVLKQINFGAQAPYNTRITLITYGSLPSTRYSFMAIRNESSLKNALNFAKYHSILDNGDNLLLALGSVKLSLLNKGQRRPLVMVVSNGAKKSDVLTATAAFIKDQFNAVISTISLNPANNLSYLATPGFNLTLSNDTAAALPTLLPQANCFCPPGYKQFVTSDVNGVSYYGNCVKYYGSFSTYDQAAKTCKKSNSTLVALTSPAKSRFVLDYLSAASTLNLPVLYAGLRRSPTNPNQFSWTSVDGDEFVLGQFPKKLDGLNFNDLKYNCSYMVKAPNHLVFPVPSLCDATYLNFVCEIRAFDSDHYN